MLRGLNLSAAYYHVSSPFVDLMASSQWYDDITQGISNPNKAPIPGVDATGWPLGLNDKQDFHILLRQGDNLPSGDYTVIADGVGRFRLSWPDTSTGKSATTLVTFDGSDAGRRKTINLPSVRPVGAFNLWLYESSFGNPLRNLKIIMPGYTETDTWRKDFIDSVSWANTIRFMDFMRTNNSTVSKWSDRDTKAYTNSTSAGVKYELMFDLVSRIGRAAWVCIPEDADDDYVMNFIALANANMDLHHTLYVEYSNEYWSGKTSVFKKFSQKGIAEGLATADEDTKAALMWGGRRAAQIHKLFHKNYKGQLCCVLSAQANQTSSFNIQLKYLDSLGLTSQVNALAIAPYFSQSALTEDEILAKWPVDPEGVKTSIFAGCRTQIAFEAAKVAAQKALANQYKKRLIAYEAGQSLIPSVKNQHTAVYDAYGAVNHDWRMVDTYYKYMNALGANGIDMACLFSHMRTDDVWGFWGMMNYLGQPLAQTPKWRAVASVLFPPNVKL